MTSSPAPARPVIAFVLSSLHFGGAERVSLNLASALKQEGYEIHFLLMQAAGEFLREAENSFTVVDLKCDRTYKLPGKLALYLLKNRPAAVISSFWKLNVCLAAVRCISPQTAIGLWEHSSPQAEGNSPTWIFAPTATVLYRLATCVITVSKSVAADILQRTIGLNGRIRTIGNAIPFPVLDSSFHFDRPKDIISIVWVGRLSTVKNPALMLDSFALLKKVNPAYRLNIVGDGTLRPSLEKHAEALGISSLVSFSGFISNPYQLIATADILVVSSLAEGLPTVIVEALYLGTNVVSTACGSGVYEILANGRIGTIVANNNPEALALGIVDRMGDLIDSATLTQSAERYAPRTIANQFLQALRIRL